MEICYRYLNLVKVANVYEDSCHVVVERSNTVRLMVFTMLVQCLAYRTERDSMSSGESREPSKINEVHALSLKRRGNRSSHINDSVTRKGLWNWEDYRATSCYAHFDIYNVEI